MNSSTQLCPVCWHASNRHESTCPWFSFHRAIPFAWLLLQDGTVRVWDCSSHACLAIIHPNPTPSHKDGPGSLIPLDQPALLLKCARSPGNTCVRFDAGGNWLLIGNADGYLVLWSCRLNAVAAHTQCTRSGGSGGSGGVGAVVPQVSFWVYVQPGIVSCLHFLLHTLLSDGAGYEIQGFFPN